MSELALRPSEGLRHLVAVTPRELAPAQQQLQEFCAGKIRELGGHVRDLAQNLRIAKKNKWRHSGIQAALGREKKRIIYYDRIKKAAQAGYLVVPNFDVDVIAVRVDRATPPRTEHGYRSKALTDVATQQLPAGRGRYVDDVQHYDHTVDFVPDGKGGLTEKNRYWPTKYDPEIDFPVTMVRPQILEATERAMALKVFDRIGVVGARRKDRDPMVLGQVLGPKKGYSQPIVTFFIAWWLDPETL